jgi:NADH dehydrogenase (ubiquinone) Fe-S protein 6
MTNTEAFGPEITYIDYRHVHCDGDGGALGHPRIFMQIGESGFVDCGYCDRRFILAAGPADTRDKRA